MSHGRIDGDNDIEIHHRRGRIEEGSGIEMPAKVNHAKAARESGQLLAAEADLQAVKFEVANAAQRRELQKRNRTAAIGGIGGIALPGDADFDRSSRP